MADADETDRKTRKAAGSAAAGAIGGFIGVLGGPAGVVVGSAVGAALPQTYDAVRSWIDQRRDRVLELSVQAVGGDENLARTLEENPSLVPLLLRASDAASRSTWDAHIDALASAFRDGVTGDRTVSDAERLLLALVPLTPDAAVILRYMTTREPTHEQNGVRYFVDTEMTESLGLGRGRVRAGLRRLEDGDVAELHAALLGGGEGWVLTDLAVDVATYMAASTKQD